MENLRPIQKLLSRLTSEYRETGFYVDEDTSVGEGGNQVYEDAMEEAGKLEGTVADLKLNGYVAVYYGSYWGWLPGIVNEISHTTFIVRSMQQLSMDN